MPYHVLPMLMEDDVAIKVYSCKVVVIELIDHGIKFLLRFD